MGTVCTSFTWVNAGTHQRSVAFPLGASREYVQVGSVLAARSALIALLTWGVGAVWTLEQPLRSLMSQLPSWQMVIGYFKEAEQIHGWPNASVKMSPLAMAAFRAPSLKPTAIFSNEVLQSLVDMPALPPGQRPALLAPVTKMWLDQTHTNTHPHTQSP